MPEVNRWFWIGGVRGADSATFRMRPGQTSTRINRIAGQRPMALGLDVVTLARAWTSQVFTRKPLSGDHGYDEFNLNQVPFGQRPHGNICGCLSGRMSRYAGLPSPQFAMAHGALNSGIGNRCVPARNLRGSGFAFRGSGFVSKSLVFFPVNSV